MAIKYRNTQRGHVVTMAEPKEVELTAGKKQALHQLRTIVRMDASKRWERVDSERAVQASTKAEPEPEVRADGVHNVGGGWHEVVVNGQVVDKVRGSDAAEEAYAGHLTQSE